MRHACPNIEGAADASITCEKAIMGCTIIPAHHHLRHRQGIRFARVDNRDLPSFSSRILLSPLREMAFRPQALEIPWKIELQPPPIYTPVTHPPTEIRPRDWRLLGSWCNLLGVLGYLWCPSSGSAKHGSTRPRSCLALFSGLARCVSDGGLYTIRHPPGWVSVLRLCLA